MSTFRPFLRFYTIGSGVHVRRGDNLGNQSDEWVADYPSYLEAEESAKSLNLGGPTEIYITRTGLRNAMRRFYGEYYIKTVEDERMTKYLREDIIKDLVCASKAILIFLDSEADKTQRIDAVEAFHKTIEIIECLLQR